MANLKMKRIPVPVKYQLKVVSIATHLPVLIEIITIDRTNGSVTYITQENRTWREMSLEKFKLLYKPWKK